MKRRSIKLLAMLMALVCTLCAMNLTAYAETVKAETVTATVSSKLSTPKVSISVSSTAEPALKLTWGKVEGANKYYIYRRDTKNGSLKFIAKTSKLYYEDNSVSKNKTYYYKVRAYKITDNKVVKKSDTSATVKKAIVTISKATNLKATTVSESKIKLTWNKVSGASRYYLFYSTSKNGTYKSIGYTKGTSYTFSKLNSSSTYYFKIKSAKILDGTTYKSSYSNVVSAKTNSKDGEFIVDFKKISNKEAGLPTGSAMTCLAMLMNHYGVDVTAKELFKYFDCSTDFYYDEDGKLWGPHILYNFVGDPTSKDKKYAYGTDIGYIGTVERKFFNENNINSVESNININYFDSSNVINGLRTNNIYLVRIRTKKEFKTISWFSRDSLFNMCIYEKYVILYGYTDKYYIVYDPYSNKTEKYLIDPGDYNTIVAFGALKKK